MPLRIDARWTAGILLVVLAGLAVWQPALPRPDRAAYDRCRQLHPQPYCLSIYRHGRL